MAVIVQLFTPRAPLFTPGRRVANTENLLTEDGDLLLTEDGEELMTEGASNT